jgi:hypothetical protein
MTIARNGARPRRIEIDFYKINHRAVVALPAILARLLPGGRIEGHEYLALNPRRADQRLGSFKVRVFGQKAGRGSDFGTGDKGGDSVSLIAYLENCSQPEAARRLARMLGIDWEVRQ